jgi:hypothetical protein
MSVQLGMVLVLAVFCAVLVFQQCMITRLRQHVVGLAHCIGLLNTGLKMVRMSASTEPTPEQVDRGMDVVMQGIARRLEEDDEDGIVH